MSDDDAVSGRGSAGMSGWPLMDDMTEYIVDALQRSVLYADAMRRRGNQYQAHLAENMPRVLSDDAELVMSGMDLPQPVSYALARIRPLPDVPTDRAKRPFVVIEPRADEGSGARHPGAASEMALALAAAHPCYFIGALPGSVPGQTPEDVMRARAAFVAKVNELHPGANGKPVVIGSAQAVWQAMTAAAMHPLRLSYEYWNDRHPMAGAVATQAEEVRKHRKPASASNPWLQAQERWSQALGAYHDLYAQTFEVVYGLPWVQAWSSPDAVQEGARPHPDDASAHRPASAGLPAAQRATMAAGERAEARAAPPPGPDSEPAKPADQVETGRMATERSASLAAAGEDRQDSHEPAPKAPQARGEKAPAAGREQPIARPASTPRAEPAAPVRPVDPVAPVAPEASRDPVQALADVVEATVDAAEPLAEPDATPQKAGKAPPVVVTRSAQAPQTAVIKPAAMPVEKVPATVSAPSAIAAAASASAAAPAGAAPAVRDDSRRVARKASAQRARATASARKSPAKATAKTPAKSAARARKRSTE